MVNVANATTNIAEGDPLLSLVGSGRDLWATEPADEYVQRLRDDGHDSITVPAAGR